MAYEISQSAVSDAVGHVVDEHFIHEARFSESDGAILEEYLFLSSVKDRICQKGEKALQRGAPQQYLETGALIGSLALIDYIKLGGSSFIKNRIHELTQPDAVVALDKAWPELAVGGTTMKRIVMHRRQYPLTGGMDEGFDKHVLPLMREAEEISRNIATVKLGVRLVAHSVYHALQ